MVIALSPMPSPISRTTLRALPPWMAFLAAWVLSTCAPEATATAGTASDAAARATTARVRRVRVGVIGVRSCQRAGVRPADQRQPTDDRTADDRRPSPR